MVGWFNRRRRREQAQAILAAAAYEAPSAEEEALAREALAQDATAREEAEACRAWASRLPAAQVEFQGDLGPILRERIRTEGAGRRANMRRWAPVLGLVLVALGVGLVYTASPWQSSGDGSAGMTASAMAAEMETARGLVEQRDYLGALEKLEAAVAQHPSDALAGQAQALIADIEFDKLQRFAQAHDAYAKLRGEFPGAFTGNPQYIDRFDLLAEAKAEDFEPLYALEAARNSLGDSVESLERVIARYPGKLVAKLATSAMCEAIETDAPSGGMHMAQALEKALAQCTNPVAVAQLNVALGDVYRTELNDPGKARSLYTTVAQTGPVVLAKVAEQALAEMESTPHR